MDYLEEYGSIIGGIIIVGLVIVGIVFIFKAALNNEHAWQQFKIDHHCKVIAKTDGQWTTGYSTSGHMHQYYTDGSVTYKCDDGVTYTKSEGE